MPVAQDVKDLLNLKMGNEINIKEWNFIKEMLEDEYKNGMRVLGERPHADLLIKEWKKELIFLDVLLKKISENIGKAKSK